MYTGYPRQEPGLQRDVLQVRNELSLKLSRKNRADVRGLVSGNYFPVLGVGSAVGRVCNASDDLIQAGIRWRAELSVLEDQFVREPQRDRPRILVNGYPLTIVG